MTTLTLIRGMPGSGKTTLAKKLQSLTNANHFEADMYFVNIHGDYIFHASKLGSAHRWCQEAARSSLNAGFNTIVSNTFTTMSELKVYRDIANEEGCDIEIILCQNEFGSVHNVPVDTLAKMKLRFEYAITRI